jgi:hypothetical protein
MSMMIDADTALVALDDAIGWRLRPALNAQKLFDDIASKLHRHPSFKQLNITEIDLLLADLKREFAHDMHTAEWQLYESFRSSIGAF